MSARQLVIGLDGFDLNLVREFGAAELPVICGLMEGGVFAAQQSVVPPATLPNWTTFLTGVDPGRHGVFDFTTREGYRVHFSAGRVREVPTIFSRLDRAGLRCACVAFPATWPPEPLEHGVFVSGWDAPVAFESDASFVWPPALYDTLQRRFELGFDDVDEFNADSSGWHTRLPTALCQRIARKVEMGRWLLESQDWDVFAIYFGESDTASHYLWSLHDTKSPRRPAGATHNDMAGLRTVYRALDEAVADLLNASGEAAGITLLSDHGSGGSSDKVLYLNRALAEQGLLTFRSQRWSDRLTARTKELALTQLSPDIRERVFGWSKRVLPSWLESRVRFGAIDMTRTIAFSEELNYFPSVHLNLRGREPKGTVSAKDREGELTKVEAALFGLRDPWSGQPVVQHVWRREQLFEGPHVERAPDLLLEMALDAGYSYNLMPSASAPAGTGAWRKLATDEYLGRKGRSLPGSHRDRGFMTLAGPDIQPIGELQAHIADTTATLLTRLHVRVPSEMSGRVLWQALRNGPQESQSLPTARDTWAEPTGGGHEAKLEARLRMLGYMD